MVKTEFARSILTVKAVVINNDNEILLLKRAEDEKTNPGKWDLPGGTLESGETLEESLKREVSEETGLEVENVEVIGTTEFSKKDKLFKEEKRGLRYLAYYKSGEVKINPEEHQEFKWLSIKEALQLFSEKDGFENEKREAVLRAKEVIKMKDALNGWRRAMADLENYKNRATKEKENFKKYCLEDYVLGLLPVLDNFEFALKHVPENESDNNWIVGILHIKKQLEDFLIENGVEEIKVKIGDKFDENVHEVIEKTKESLKIKEIVKKGYKIENRIIRPVMVKL